MNIYSVHHHEFFYVGRRGSVPLRSNANANNRVTPDIYDLAEKRGALKKPLPRCRLGSCHPEPRNNAPPRMGKNKRRKKSKLAIPIANALILSISKNGFTSQFPLR